MRALRETDAKGLRQGDETRRQPLPQDVEQEQRPCRRPASLGRAARVENPRALEALHLRQVRVAVDDGVAAGETREEARLAPGAGAGDVHEPDPDLLDRDDALFRKRASEQRLVGVAPDRLDRAERPQLLERRRRLDVPGVQDQVRGRQQLDALLGQPPSPTGQMRVGDDADARQPRPFRNRPSR